MDPIPPTQEAVDEYGPFSFEGTDLLPRLSALSEEVQGRVPTCVGLSLSMVDLDVTFTLVATDRRIATLDAMQYIDGGPCVEAIAADSSTTFAAGVEGQDGDRWGLFSRASSDLGIASTLSLPLLRAGATVGSFNLYASTIDAFDGRHEELADVLGAWAGGAVTDADLDFSSRDVAGRAPEILRGATRLIIARRLLERARSLPGDEAEVRLRDAAVRAGAPLEVVVDTVIAVLGSA